VRLLVWSAFRNGRGADVEVVEAFDGGVEKHRRIRCEKSASC
jgi:hypothetical protein